MYQIKSFSWKLATMVCLCLSLNGCPALGPLIIRSIAVTIGEMLIRTTVGDLTEKVIDWILGYDENTQSSERVNNVIQPFRNNPNIGRNTQGMYVVVEGSRDGGAGQKSQIFIKPKHLIYERMGPNTAWEPTIETKRLLKIRYITGSIQISLLDLNYNPGNVDGVPGPRTNAAIRDFQRANGLEIREISYEDVNDATIQKLLGTNFFNSII